MLTLNEAANLPACMAALAWADDVVVLDSFSQDETMAVAEEAGADGGAKAAGRYDAWRLPSGMMFMGRWLRYSGLYPSFQVRLGHRDRFRFKQVGHGQREDLAPERVGTLTEPYLHYSFSKGLSDGVEKHNRYASAEAREAVRLLATGGGLDWAGLLARVG